MKILHVYKAFELFTKGGGVERYIHCLANEQHALGFETAVAAAITDPADAARSARTAPPRYKVAEGGLAALWREVGNADIVHIHGPRTAYSAIAGIFAWLRGKRLAYTVHCFYSGKTTLQRFVHRVWEQTVERFLLSAARCVIVLSDFWLGEVAKRGLPAKRCVVVPNGVNTAAFADEPKAATTLAGNPSILLVSRLDPVKRIEDLIYALDQPGLEGAHAHIVGRGADEARLREIAATVPSRQARVHFCGFLSDEEVASLAQGAGLFALPSAEEGMPTTFLEMLARGLPVVGSDNAGNLAIAKALDWKYIHPVGDVAAMARLIVEAAGTKVSEDMQRTLKARFDWSAIAPQIIRAYEIARG